MKKNDKKLFLLFPKNKNNKNIALALHMPSRASFFYPLSFSNPKNNNNTISTYYKNSIHKYVKNKIASESMNNIKNISFKLFSNSKESIDKINYGIYSLTKNNSMSSTNFFTIKNRKQKLRNIFQKKLLTINEKNKLKYMIKNFNDNKIITKELFDLERNHPLNSLTKSSFRFLSDENHKYINKCRKKRNKNEEINKNFLTTSNMIVRFNNRANEILKNKSLKSIKFSKNKNEFRKQIINSYTDSEKKEKDINKNKLYYNDALNIFELFDEKKIKDALKLEEIFYKEKSTKYYQGKPLYLYIKEMNRRMSKNNIEIETDNEDRVDLTQKNFSYSKHYNNNDIKNISNIKSKHSIEALSEKKCKESKKQYDNYLRKKFRNKAKLLADSLYEIKDLPEKVLRKTKFHINYFNFNIKNLKRIIKVNSIRKNLFSPEDDDLLTNNAKKLKEEIRKTEDSFYTIFRGKCQLDFIKGNVKPSTIQRLNIMKNSHFGLPC